MTKYTIYGQKYADTWTLQLYVMVEFLFPKPFVLMSCSLHSGFSLSSRCWTCYRDLLPFCHKSIGDVGWSGLAHSPVQPKVLDRVEVWALTSQSSSSTPNFSKHFFMYLTLSTTALSCWNREKTNTNSKISSYAGALRLPFTGTKGLRPNQEKTPRPELHQIMCPHTFDHIVYI